MCRVQVGNPYEPGLPVEVDVVVFRVMGSEGGFVKTQAGVVLYLVVPQSHQEAGDIHGAPSGVHVVGTWIAGLLTGDWEEPFDCPIETGPGGTAGLVGIVDTETVVNSLNAVSDPWLGPSMADWTGLQPEATPPAPTIGMQPTLSPVLGS